MNKELEGRTGIITGASSGIGYAIANVLASSGARVYALSRTGAVKPGLEPSVEGVVHVTGDVTTPALRKGDLLLAASGSGETAGILRTVMKAKDLGAVTALITANPGSSIAREAELVIGLPAQKSSQPGASLFEQELLITLDAFIAELMRTKELPPETVYRRHANLE